MESKLEPWYKFFNMDEYNLIMGHINFTYGYTGKLCPSKYDIFAAFKYFEPEELKVVIIGDEPQSDGYDASGIAFGRRGYKPLSPSLKMFENSITQPKEEFSGNYISKYELDGSLLHWARQGVLLLNSALTVEKDSPGIHMDMWDMFMKDFIKTISDSIPGVAYVLLGQEARKFERFISKERGNLIIIDDLPCEYLDRNTLHKYNFFNTINTFLQKDDGAEINWLNKTWENIFEGNESFNDYYGYYD